MDHLSATPDDSCHFKHLIKSRHAISSGLQPLQVALATSNLYESLSLVEYTHSDIKPRYQLRSIVHINKCNYYDNLFLFNSYITELEKGVPEPTVVLLTYVTL